MRFVSLFAGIGGFDLGFERAGMTCVAQVENDPYCNRVLAKHWPDVPRWGDITKLDPAELPEHELMCGGFPCQDISNAGKRAGIDGERSGLWSEYVRLIRAVRPRIVVVENVAALLTRGLDRVLGDLAACGYHAEWDCIRSGDIGTHFIGDRLYLIASPHRIRLQWLRALSVASFPWTTRQLERLLESEAQLGVPAGSRGRISDGVPNRVDRLRGLGNAVVPAVAEVVGRAIMEAQA